MGNQAGSLKKHIETAEKTGDSRILYGFDTILLSAIDQYSRCPLLFWPEVGKIPTWTDKGDQVSHNDKKSNHVNFRLLGTWEILICPGTRSRCCRKTSERSKCWKLSPWQRTNWTLSRRWNHNMCQNFEILPMTNLLDSMYHCIRQPELLQDMGKLTKLENLNLSFNLIQSIPMSLQQLKNLK